MEKILISRVQAAELLGITSRHLITLEQLGQIPAPRRLGRRCLFDASELKDWARKGCPPAAKYTAIQQGNR